MRSKCFQSRRYQPFCRFWRPKGPWIWCWHLWVPWILGRVCIVALLTSAAELDLELLQTHTVCVQPLTFTISIAFIAVVTLHYSSIRQDRQQREYASFIVSKGQTSAGRVFKMLKIVMKMWGVMMERIDQRREESAYHICSFSNRLYN